MLPSGVRYRPTMKRTLPTLLVLAAAGPALAGNLLLNPGFQYAGDGTVAPSITAQHWTAWGQASRENWGSHDGDGYLASINNRDGGLANGGWYQDVPGFRNTDYHFSGWLCIDVGHTNAATRLKIEFFDAGLGTMLGAVTTTVVGLGPGWTYHVVEGVSSSNAVNVRVVVEAVGQGTNGTVKFDHARLLALPPNRLKNPGFRYGWGGASGVGGDAQGWHRWGDVTRENWADQDGDGYMATLHNWSNTSSDAYGYQDVEAEGGAEYALAGYFYADAAYTAAEVALKLEFYDIHRAWIAAASTAATGLGPSWQLFEVSATAPTNACWLRAVVAAVGQGSTDTLKVDHFRLAGTSTNRLPNAGFLFASDGSTNADVDAQYWSRWGNGERTTGSGHDGDGHVATIHNRSNAAAAGGWFQEVLARSRLRYVFSAWLEADADYTFGTADLKLEFYDFDGTHLQTFSSNFTSVPTAWTSLTVRADAPAATAWVRPVIAVTGQGTNGELRLDDLRLTTELRPGLQRTEPAQGAYPGACIDWDAGDAVGFDALVGWDHAVFGEFMDFPMASYAALDGHLAQLQSLGAIWAVTPFPPNLAAVTTEACTNFAAWCAGWNRQGVPIQVRLCHEMNGDWYAWGMKPAQYRQAFRRMADAVHRQATNTAMVWAPFTASPYAGSYQGRTREVYTNSYGTLEDWCLLDTDGNGVISTLCFGGTDEPYDPFYPGDEYVDWVGVSVYHWGVGWTDCVHCAASGFRYNGYPDDRQYTDEMTGEGIWTPDFYLDYAEGRDKPLAIGETAAAYRPAEEIPPVPYDNFTNDELFIKGKWIEQLYNAGGDNANALDVVRHFPLVKEICWFDFYKFECAGCHTVDWRICSNPSVVTSYLGEVNTRKGDVRYFLRADDVNGCVYGWNSSLQGWAGGGSPFTVYVDTTSPHERRGCVNIYYDGSSSPSGKAVMVRAEALPDARAWGYFDAIYLQAKVPVGVPWASFRLIMQSAETASDALATVAGTADGAWRQLVFPYEWSRHDASSWLSLRLEVDLPSGVSRTVYIDALQAVSDNDADGLPNEEDPDDDNDGMTDAYETEYALDTFDASDAGEDYDGDTATNLEEARMNTNPWSVASVLRVLDIRPLPGPLAVLEWEGRSGVTYRCQVAAGGTGAWANTGSPVAPAQHGPLSLTNDCGAMSNGWYRLVVP